MANFATETDPAVIQLLLLGVLLLAYVLGLLVGRRRPQDAQDAAGARITDSSLALMGLLLGFSFAMGLAKHDRRRELVVTDSNAIGDFYTCVCMLKDSPPRQELIRLIREYTTYRLEVARAGAPDGEARQAAMDRIAGMQDRMTQLVRQVVNEGSPVAVPLVNTLNEVTSAHATRLMANRDRIPPSIVALLFLAAGVSMALLGWQQGAAGRRFCFSTLWLIALIVATLYTTMDLNQPQRGLIRVGQEPLEWLLRSMGPG